MKVYAGWYVVATSVLVLMVLLGTTFTAFGLYVVPVSSDLGLSRADTNSAMILLNIGNAVVAPIIGRMLDRHPIRRIMMACATLFGVALVMLGASSSILLSAFVVVLPLAIALQGAGTLTVTVLIARWFSAQRGRAMALAMMGMSLASVIVTPLVGLVIEAYGWRATLISTGISGAVVLLLAAAFVRDRPGTTDVEGGVPSSPSASHAASASPHKVSVILKMPQFWTVAVASALALAVTQAIGVTLAPLGLGAGLNMVRVAGLISASGVAALVTKLVLAAVVDRMDRFSFLAVVFLVLAMANGALIIDQSYASLLGFALVLGVALGSIVPVYYALLADLFGAASFGTVRGLTVPIGAVVGAVAVRFAGEVFDRTGAYDVMFATFVVAQIIAAAIMFSTRLLGRPSRTAKSIATPQPRGH
jgi:sugar phosphate permease